MVDPVGGFFSQNILEKRTAGLNLKNIPLLKGEGERYTKHKFGGFHVSFQGLKLPRPRT